MPLRYALFRFVLEFYKNQMGDDVRRHLWFLHTNVHISNSTEPTNLNVGTNIQQHEIHLRIKVQVTLTKAEDHK